MSNHDFQDRLKRIGFGAPQPASASWVPQTANTKAPGPNYRLIGAGGALIGLGPQVMKYTNRSYEPIRDNYGIATAAALGLAGLAAIVYGAVLIYRGTRRNHAAQADNAASPRPDIAAQVRQPSNAARWFFSLLGFAFGTTACLYMFLGAAARFVDTERAQTVSNGGVIIALLLGLVSLIFGFVGLFLRGSGLWRVPYFFVAAGIITFCAVRLFRINMLDWPQFMAQLQ
jgi:hypothetical protein